MDQREIIIKRRFALNGVLDKLLNQFDTPAISVDEEVAHEIRLKNVLEKIENINKELARLDSANSPQIKPSSSLTDTSMALLHKVKPEGLHPCDKVSKNMMTNIAKRLCGKVAVVTASTDGIGYAIAKRLGLESAKVVVSSRKEQNVARAVEELKKSGLSDVMGVVCDVAKPEERQTLFQEAVARFGGIDILVSNAAVNPKVAYPNTGGVIQCSADVWDKVFEVNVKSTFLLTKEVMPHLRKRGGGSIIYVSSFAGLQPLSSLGAYNVSKTALLGLTKTVAQEVARENIRVNCLAPGLIRTNFSRSLHEDESTRQSILSAVPMGRMGTPDEMDGTVAFLCSDDASYITGETLAVAGGGIGWPHK